MKSHAAHASFDKLKLPIRFKIILLIVITVVASLTGFLYLGIELIQKDKASYIYDFSSAELRSAADALLNQIGAADRAIQGVAGTLFLPGLPPETEREIFRTIGSGYGIQSLLFFRPQLSGSLSEIKAYGTPAEIEAARLVPARLGWGASQYNETPMLLGTPEKGLIPLGGKAHSGTGEVLAYLALLKLDEAPLAALGHGYDVYLLDGDSHVVLKRTADPNGQSLDILAPLARALPSFTAETGVREVQLPQGEYLMAYRRFPAGKLLLISLIRKTEAFQASRDLIEKTIPIAVSILLLASGLALLLARTLTSRLRRLEHATKTVSEGDFTFRIPAGRGPADEVAQLSASFNLMSDEIGALMDKTAAKARMEKELETAQAFQRALFPAEPFNNGTFSVAAQYHPASECAGDWWQYSLMRDHLLVVVGDVTGHGAGAAFMTAIVQGAFSEWRARVSPDLGGAEILVDLAQTLNSIVLASGHGEALMTLLAFTIDLKTAELWLISASHPLPYLFRPSAASKAGTDFRKNFISVRLEPAPALGLQKNFQVQPVSIQLQPGDVILSYSDGLFESREGDGIRQKKLDVLEEFAVLSEHPSATANGIRKTLMQRTSRFFAEANEVNPDDVTILITAVSRTPHPTLHRS